MSSRPRDGVLGLILALAIFLAMGLWMQARVFAFAEELMLHTTPRVAALSPEQPASGPLRWEPSCGDSPAPAAVLSPHRRPTHSLCSGGRRYPLIVASYMAGYFYWPFAALAPFHHDDLRSLRRITSVFGLLDITLTFLVLRRLGARTLAPLAAIAIAVSPCFLVTHSALVHFETLPWTFLMAAVLALSGCRALSPTPPDGTEARAPTSRLLLGALFLGLSLASNLKAIFAIGPALFVALRLGVRLRPIKPSQWMGIVAAGALPLAPSLWFALSHPSMFLAGDKSGDMGSALRQNLVHPERLLGTLGDMLMFWSNLGRYMDPRGVAPLDVLAYAIAAAAFLFVFIDGARTLRRRRGCPITAATAAIVVAHLLMLFLLVQSYPINFTPLHAAFGLRAALAAHRLSAWLAPERPRLALLSTSLAVIPFVVASIRSGQALYAIPAPFNLFAEERLVEHLRAVDPGDGEIHTVSTENLMTGVIVSMSRGQLHVAEAQDYLIGCRNRRRDDPSLVTGAACYEARYRRILEGLPSEGALRFVLPADIEVLRDRSRRGAAAAMREGLLSAARALGKRATVEATFGTAAGIPAIVVVRVDS